MNHWTGQISVTEKMRETREINKYRTLFRMKYYILTALLFLSFMGIQQTGLLDPIVITYKSFAVSLMPLFHSYGGGGYLKPPVFYGGTLISALFILIIFMNRIMPRFWCRILCPLGALLGIFSMLSPYRIRRVTLINALTAVTVLKTAREDVIRIRSYT